MGECDFENCWGNSPNCPKFNTHKKVVLHFFIPMLLLPKTPTLIYLKLKKNKVPKTHSLFTFTFTSLSSQARKEEVDSEDGSAPYSDLQKKAPFIIPLNLTFFHFHQKKIGLNFTKDIPLKLNRTKKKFTKKLNSPSILQRNPRKNPTKKKINPEILPQIYR